VEEALTLSDRIVVLRQGQVVRDLEVDLPRPRDPESVAEEPGFMPLRRELMELL
jgi:NitT/TauT family transport system ATP-binding protein